MRVQCRGGTHFHNVPDELAQAKSPGRVHEGERTTIYHGGVQTVHEGDAQECAPHLQLTVRGGGEYGI